MTPYFLPSIVRLTSMPGPTPVPTPKSSTRVTLYVPSDISSIRKE